MTRDTIIRFVRLSDCHKLARKDFPVHGIWKIPGTAKFARQNWKDTRDMQGWSSTSQLRENPEVPKRISKPISESQGFETLFAQHWLDGLWSIKWEDNSNEYSRHRSRTCHDPLMGFIWLYRHHEVAQLQACNPWQKKHSNETVVARMAR